MRSQARRATWFVLLLQAASCSGIPGPAEDEDTGSGGMNQGVASGGAQSGGVQSGGVQSGGAPSSGGLGPSGGSAQPGGGAPSAGGSAGGLGNGSGGTLTTGGGAPASGGALSSGGQNGSGGAPSGPYKFMALGDSITGTTCYTQYLAQAFIDAETPDVTFAGSVTNNQVCSGTGNTKSEGHGGYLVTYLTTNSPPQSGKGTLTELTQWTQAKPDIVLIHFGTNDVWNNIPAAQILEAESFVIDEFRKQNPNILFFISKIIPMNPDGCSDCSSRVVALNTNVTEEWTEALSTPTSPVRIVDQWTGFSAQDDTSDGVHPKPAGGQKMATRAFETIASALQ